MTTDTRDRGATLPIVAMLISVIVLMTAFSIDLGRQRSSRRTMQARADIVALDLARLADGRTEAEIEAGSLNQIPAHDALLQSASRNGIAIAQISLDWGIWDGSSFDTDSAPFPNSVKVTTNETTDYYFRPGTGEVQRDAVALNAPLTDGCPPSDPNYPDCLPEPECPPSDPNYPDCLPDPTPDCTVDCDPVGALVDLTVGSVAASFQSNVPDSISLDREVNVLNSRLAAHFGASVPNPGSAGFDLVGYRGLATADVDVWRVAAEAGFASPNDLLDATITVEELFDATLSALDQQADDGDPAAAGAAIELERFRAQMGVDNDLQLRLGDTIGYQHGGDDAGASGAVSLLDLLSGSAEAISGTSVVSYQVTSTVPGVSSVTVTQRLIEPATTELGLAIGGTATNKQMRFQVDLTVAPLAGMSQPVTIPIVVEAATATGTVNRLTCATPSEDSEAEIFVGTSAVRTTIGTAANLAADNLSIDEGVLVEGGGMTVSALLNLGLNLGRITGLDLSGTTTGTSTAMLGGGSSTLVFQSLAPPVAYQRAQGGLGATSLGTQTSSSFAASLDNAPLGTTASAAMASQLGYVFNNLDASILNPILEAAGVGIAGADVKADNMQCWGPRLVA